MSTGRDTAKVRKLNANPQVSLSFRTWNMFISQGTGRICTEEDVVQRVAGILNRKYGGAWGSETQFVRRLLHDDIVLLEIVPHSQRQFP